MKLNSQHSQPLFAQDDLKVLDALDRAQLIAFAPYVWEVSKLLIDYNILRVVELSRNEGVTITEVAHQVKMSHYGVRILMEAGLGIGVLFRKDSKYFLAKTGHLLLNHEMTKVNYEFMRDVCAQGAPSLEACILDSKPYGLKTLGDWPTLYQGLSEFPEPAKTSWLNFDHYYSDIVFPIALPIVFENNPKKILDIGGNTGKWTLHCLNFNKEVEMGIVDLPGQIAMAKQNVNDAGFEGRVEYHPQDILADENLLPQEYDIIWMSQFLDCFADDEIVKILKKCYEVSDDNTRIFINETFWDRQKFKTSAFALQMTSIYFTNMANGNSQMYDSEVFYKLIEDAGFEILHVKDNVGLSHTILELKKK
jgi:ubiquinone/menaquinone biosynthesis C-methylase UbiE